MANILLTTWGSHGDIDPFLGLGLGLQRRGHLVTLATLDYFQALITASGLTFHAIRPSVSPEDTALVQRIMDPRRGPEYLLRKIVFPGVDDMYRDLQPAVDRADLIVTHPLTSAAVIHAERTRKPWVSVVLAPASFLSMYEPPVLPPATWLKTLETVTAAPSRAFIKLGRWMTGLWASDVYALRKRLGLPKGLNPMTDGQHSPFAVLALYSSVLGKPQPDWPRHVTVTGHMFHDAPHGTALSGELEAFLANGRPPVVFTLGSSAVMVPGDFWSESAAAIQTLGERAVFLVGPGKAESIGANCPPDIHVVDGAPHSLLMPRASAVVQQCGIGTLAQSLRSGRPMLAVPFAHDQPDNAWRAARLGMARVLYPNRYRRGRVVAELRALLSTGAYRRAAEDVATRVRSEPGVEGACDVVEQVLQRSTGTSG
jgi:UDP:flavonoid glycosyltransferase YjiC (YdhE family)